MVMKFSLSPHLLKGRFQGYLNPSYEAKVLEGMGLKY
jgi:hypothetical protein